MGSMMGIPPHQELPVPASSSLATTAVPAELLPGHSRNSSGTSHSGSGSASGYGSLASQSQHSRQSSSGELGHFRFFFLIFFLLLLHLHRVTYPLNDAQDDDRFAFVFFVCFFFLFGCFPFSKSPRAPEKKDFLLGPFGRHASPSCVYLSAVTESYPALPPHLPELEVVMRIRQSGHRATGGPLVRLPAGQTR